MIRKDRELRYKITGEDQTKAATESAKGNLASLSGAARAVAPLISAAFGAAVLKEAANAYIRQEQAIFQLEQRLKSTGGAAGRTSQDLQQMASSLQGVTTFGDEAIIEMQSLLLTFTQVRDVNFDDATEAILNVSQAMGQDLKSSALQVGKALNDPILGVTALARSGIQFSQDQKVMIKSLVETGDVAGAQKIILQELEVQFGGAARAATQGLGGALKQLSNASADASEKLGERLAPGLTILAQEMKRVTEEGGAMTLMLDGAEIFFDTLTTSVLTTAFALTQVGSGIGAVAAAMSFAVTGEFELAKKALASYGDDVEAEYLRLEQQILKLQSPVPKKIDQPARQLGPPAVEGTTKDSQPILGNVDGSNFYGPGFWESKAQAEADAYNRSLTMQMEYNAARFAQDVTDGELMRDLWLTSIDERVAAEQRGNQMMIQNEYQLASQKEQIWRNSSSAFMNFTNAISTVAGNKNKALFRLNQIAGIANATIDTHAGAAKALASVPYPYNLAAAASVIAYGMARVASIASQSFSSGGESGAAAGGTGQGTASSPVVTQPQGIGAGGGTVTINIHGAIGERQWFEDNLPQVLQELSARNVNVGYQPRAT